MNKTLTLLGLALSTLFSFSGNAQVNLNSGLVAYYPFNGNANDASGNGINGTVSGATLTTDESGNANNAYYFDGINAYISLPFSPLYNFAPADSFSLAAWILPDNSTWPAQALVVKAPYNSNYTAANWNYGLYLENNKAMSGWANNNFLDGTTTLNLTTCWHHVAVTYRNGNWQLFVDGILEAFDYSQTMFILQDGFSSICLGKKGEAFGDWYKGKLDEVRIYNRRLNQDEINVLSTRTTICSSGPPCNCPSSSGNLIQNGDFEAPNTTSPAPPYGGFQSDYASTYPGPGSWGFFQWTTNANQQQSFWCTTTGTNHYLLFDGATTGTGNLAVAPYDILRYPNIPVIPGQTYRISYDAMNVMPGGVPATVDIKVNGVSLGTDVISNTCLPFNNHTYCWTATGNTAMLTLNVGVGAGIGRDLAIDNVFFGACQPAPDTIINKYAAVLATQPCDNVFTVDTATDFNAGDTVLVIQMKGAVIDTSNTAAFGTVLDYRNAGNYEINVVDSKTGNDIKLKYELKRQYDIPDGKVQLVRIPHFQNYTVNQPHTCMPWNGSKGGVFAIDVVDTLNLHANINANGKGFRGGIANTFPSSVTSCNVTAYSMGPNIDDGGMKGEGMANVSLSKSYGKGCLANGGGGGNGHNAGGAGGGNAGSGGIGGSEFSGCSSNPSINNTGGIPGVSLIYSNIANKIFSGGGGGTGQVNTQTVANGGNGGGIIILNAAIIKGGTGNISADGSDGLGCVNNGTFGSCHDGMGGGGGGGTVLVNVSTIIGTVSVLVRGGKGADEAGSAIYANVGPGGGGGAGVAWFNSAAVPAGVIMYSNGGTNGNIIYSGSNWGADDGQPGLTLTNLQVPIGNVLFVPSNVNPGFTHTVSGCKTVSFMDGSNGASGWQWFFGDNSGSSLQNPVHTYANIGTYQVKLIVTDSNGCKDSVIQSLTLVQPEFADAGPDTFFCEGRPVQLQASGGTSYQWSPAAGLSDPSIDNPVASPSVTTSYGVTVIDANGCQDNDTVVVTWLPGPTVRISPDEVEGCAQEPVQLIATGAIQYVWSPATGLDDPFIANPVASPVSSTTYIVSGTDDIGCTGRDTISVTVRPAPQIQATSDGEPISCAASPVQLHAYGASSYTWSPGFMLSDSTSAHPTAAPSVTTLFVLTGKDTYGCTGTDTITIRSIAHATYFMPNAFTPNGDGRNDKIYPIVYCEFEFESFHIFNRWGQRVFYTVKYRDGWNGHFNGVPAETGTYYYYVEGYKPDGKRVLYKGDIVLIR